MKPSSQFASIACAIAFAALFPVALSAQAQVQGTVSNGTTGRAVGGQEVRLLMPRGGMQQVATATADATGHFAFSADGIDPKSFYLVSTDFAGATYNAPATFDSSGNANVSLTVFDSTRSPAGMRIPGARVFVGALAGNSGPELHVQEEYAIQNSTKPPRAYAAPDATFRFSVPADAGTPTVSVAGLMNMSLPQTPELGKTSGEFSIRYALKPGVTQVTIQYTRAYDSSGVDLKDRVSLPIDQAELYVYPSTLAVAAPGFQASGSDNVHKIQVYGAPQLARDTTALSIRLSGEAASGPPPGLDQGNQGGESGSNQGEGQSQDQVKTVPNSISQLTGPVLVAFLLLLLWALGVRVAKEWPRLKAQAGAEPNLLLNAKIEKLLNSVADLDELFSAGKIAEPKYWKERLDLKARLVAELKKTPPSLLESYAARQQPR
ncbi:MAG TPA: hypothetical protein VMT20_29630 [Terriglobia bacterium]|nr:hypothetical protein [Terriglobia bacterium]